MRTVRCYLPLLMRHDARDRVSRSGMHSACGNAAVAVERLLKSPELSRSPSIRVQLQEKVTDHDLAQNKATWTRLPLICQGLTPKDSQTLQR